MPDDLRELSNTELEQALADLGATMPSPRTRDLSEAVLQSIAAGPSPPDQPSSGLSTSVQQLLGFGLLAVVLVGAGLLALWPGVPSSGNDQPASQVDSPAGQKVVVYGGDLAEAERQELAQVFGIDQEAAADTVSSGELAAGLETAGLPAAPTDKAISSTLLTCVEKGEGLRVRTQQITRIPAGAYAAALLTAGLADGSVVIAAPATNPVTGETALVGVLKAFPHCQSGMKPEPTRVRLAHEQLRITAALAGETEDLTKASGLMLTVVQAVVTGRAQDDTAIGAVLDAAAAAEGVALNPEQRGESIAFLRKLGGLDFGPYANGYQVEQPAPNEVRVVPAGANRSGGTAALA